MEENRFDDIAEEMRQKIEYEMNKVEQKAEKTSSSILQRIVEAVRNGLKKVTESAEQEIITVEDLSKRKMFLEKSTQEAIEKFREKAEKMDKERRRQVDREKTYYTETELLRYRGLMDQKKRLEENTYANSEALRGEYFSLGKTEWEAYADYIYDMCAASVQGLATEEKNTLLGVFSEVRREIEKSYEELLKNQSRMENKLGDYGGLYINKSDIKTSKPIRYNDISLDNMRQSTQALLNYEMYLTEAKELLYDVFPTSGVSESAKTKNREHIKEFFAELAQMSVSEGAMFASYITTLPKGEATEYLTAWAEKQELARAIAKKLYSDDQAEVFEESAASMSAAFADSLEKHFETIPEGFYQRGVLSAQSFSEGFKAEMQNALSDVTKSIGSVAAGVTAGGLTGSSIQSNVINNSSYNIFSSKPENTALEIAKYDTMKRMLLG